MPLVPVGMDNSRLQDHDDASRTGRTYAAHNGPHLKVATSS